MKMYDMILKKIIIIIILFTAATGFAQENRPIGKVVAVRGEILAINMNLEQRELSINAPVFLNDNIKTLQGRIQLMFNDNTLITLGSDTEIKLTKYSWKPEDKNPAMETRVEEGSFRIMGGAITRVAPDNFITHTPSGTIGIRGSMYAGIVKGEMLSVLFLGGRGIHIKNDMGFVNITEPGFGTTIKSAAEAPEKPKRMTPEELMAFETVLAANQKGNPSDSAQSQTEQSEPLQDDLTQTGALSSDTDKKRKPPVSSLKNSIFDVTEAIAASSQENRNTSLISDGAEQEIKSLLFNLGYSESFTRSSLVPSTGMWVYTGKLKNMLSPETPEKIKFVVNWDTGRIFGLENFSNSSKTINTGFGFGNVSPTGAIFDFHVYGSDNFNDSGIIRALTGSETFGHFYGTEPGGLGLAMKGYDINLQNSNDQVFWKDVSAAIIESKHVSTDSGTQTWKGFFTGIAEDMTSPNVNRRAFNNNSADDFTLTINKDKGTFTGSMSGKDFTDSGNYITGLKIGGGTKDSVFIADKILGASLSGSQAISIDGNLTGLKPYGNFMVTSDAYALSTYTTWGYWEAAYFEPGKKTTYHIHVPGSLWIAGNPTPKKTIASLIGSSFMGIYSGKAEGVMFDQSSPMTRMTNGTTNLTIDFASDAPVPVSGNISFNEIALPVISTSPIKVSASGFSAGISGATASKVNGTFFGPNAEAAAGNFSAAMPDGKQYHGIFAGNR